MKALQTLPVARLWARESDVRSFVSFILASALVVLAMKMIAPPTQLGLAVGAWPSGGPAPSQVVDRSHKGDNLQLPTANGRRKLPHNAPAMLTGCEPVFSSLSAGARANFAGRCIA